MATKKNTAKQTKAVSPYQLPPDAQHFIREDLQLAPTGLFGNMAANQVNRPALLIVQPMSRMPDAVRNIGRIYNTVTGLFYDSVEIAIVVAPAMQDVPRTMKEVKTDRSGTVIYDYNARIVCGSPNGVFPYSDYIGTSVGTLVGEEFDGEKIPESCEGCIFNSSGKCKSTYRYFALQIVEGKVIPVVFRLKGYAIDSARDLNTRLKTLEETKGQYWTFEMSVQESPKKEKVYVPVFNPLNEVKDRDFLQYVYGMNQEYREKQERILADQTLRIQQMREDAE